jgi:hypothetical protein
MKYIKKYESISEYKEKNLGFSSIGDYVLIDLDKIRKEAEEQFIDHFLDDEEEEDDDYDGNFWNNVLPYAKIYRIFDRAYTNYRMRLSNNTIYDIEEETIIRLLNQDEIDTYESMISAKKYNL